MMTCRDVSLLTSTDGLRQAPWRTRIGVAVHLFMCRHCRRFGRLMRAMGRGAAAAGNDYERELPVDYEARVARAARSRPGTPGKPDSQKGC